MKVKIGRKTYTGTLKAGKVTIRLARFFKAGMVRASVTYLGDALTESARSTATIKVNKPTR